MWTHQQTIPGSVSMNKTPPTQLSSHQPWLSLVFSAVPPSSYMKLAPSLGSLHQVSSKMLCSEQPAEAPCFHLWMLVPSTYQSTALEWKDPLALHELISELLYMFGSVNRSLSRGLHVLWGQPFMGYSFYSDVGTWGPCSCPLYPEGTFLSPSPSPEVSFPLSVQQKSGQALCSQPPSTGPKV